MIDRSFTLLHSTRAIHGMAGAPGEMETDAARSRARSVPDRHSEHSMIGKFIDTINDEETSAQTLTSYSPVLPQGSRKRIEGGAAFTAIH